MTQDPNTAVIETKDVAPENDDRLPAEPLPRRGFLTKALATLVGGFVSLFPLAVGALTFFDPLRSGRRKTPSGVESSVDAEGYVRIAPVSSLPEDGRPQSFKVVADHVDAWTYFPNEPVGSIYLRKVGENVIAFHTTCPHAGCAVDFHSGKNAFHCPCHNSSFTLEGERSADSPSARDLDTLDVKVTVGIVWVKYQNFRTGTAEKLADA